MVRDPREIMEVIWCINTGRPARPIDEYDQITLLALFFEAEEAKKEQDRIRSRSTVSHWTEEEPLVLTGDPLVDKWEREIAAGRDPDLDEEL